MRVRIRGPYSVQALQQETVTEEVSKVANGHREAGNQADGNLGQEGVALKSRSV